MKYFNQKDLINKVGNLKPGAPLDKFIGEATFPNFKSLAPGATIKFDFPLTALVGPNGSGKSSILHALWGMPLRQSTSRFWFSTMLDPIEEGGTLGSPRYFFSHYINPLKKFVQTRKMRISQRKGYWEPARLSIRDGMSALPEMTKTDEPYRSLDRWNPPSRRVIYINFKCEFSSFDRFFYFPSRGRTLDERQVEFLKGASKLRSIIDRNLKSYSPGGKEAVFENRDLNNEELEWISYILGRDYQSARFVQHRLYGNIESPTVVFRRSDKTYSEAFAGSGELAVTLAVMRLVDAPKETLILLDEPETSLHPGAQERLVNFLLKMILDKKAQVVMSTHSPTMVEGLPTRAIAVLEELPDGKSMVLAPTHPQVAFNRLGAKGQSRFVVAVEDALLLSLVEIAFKTLDAGEQEAIELYIPPGGASSILTFEIFLWQEARRRVYVILDGDQKPVKKLPDPSTLNETQLLSLGGEIKNAFGVEPIHVRDGHIEPASRYVRWVNERLRFLTALCPEYVLLEGLIGRQAASSEAKTNLQAKKRLVAEMEKRNHRTDAVSLAAAASFIVKPGLEAYEHIIALSNVLREFLAHDLKTRD